MIQCAVYSVKYPTIWSGMVSGVNMCQESRSQRSLWSPRSRVGWHDVAQMGQTPVTPGQWRHWALVTGHRGGADDHRHALCHNFFVCFVLMLRPFTGWLTSRSSPIIAVGTDIFDYRTSAYQIYLYVIKYKRKVKIIWCVWYDTFNHATFVCIVITINMYKRMWIVK